MREVQKDVLEGFFLTMLGETFRHLWIKNQETEFSDMMAVVVYPNGAIGIGLMLPFFEKYCPGREVPTLASILNYNADMMAACKHYVNESR